MTFDKYNIALIIIAILVTILIVALAVSLVRRRRERRRPRWEDMYPDEQASRRRAAATQSGSAAPVDASSNVRVEPSATAASPAPPAETEKPRPSSPQSDRASTPSRDLSASAPASPPPLRDDSFDRRIVQSRQTPIAPRPNETASSAPSVPAPTLLKTSQRIESRKTSAPSLPQQPSAPIAPETLDESTTYKLKLIVSDETRNEEARLSALDRVLKTGARDDVLHVLLTGLNSAHLTLQIRALEEISLRGDEQLLDDVIPMLESENEDIAMSAVVALESIGGPIVEQALLAGLDSRHLAVRRKITSSFVALNSAVVENSLIEMAADSEPRRARIALQVLGECGRQASLEALRSLLSIQTPSSQIRSDIQEANRKIQLRIEGSSGTAEYPSFQTEGGAGQQAVDQPTGGDDEFSLTLDPDLFKPKG